MKVRTSRHSIRRVTLMSASAVLLAGCAAPIHNVQLDVPPVPATGRIAVVDDRLDKQVTIRAVTYTGSMQLYTFDAQPPLTEALARLIEREKPAAASSRVVIQRLDLQARIGFGAADELTCQMESEVTAAGATKRVRSAARNTENLSPRVQVMGATALNTCLLRHARDIAAVF